jgi:hypothetical protein
VFLTGKSLSRRTVLRGVGSTVALPFLDAMVPAGVRAARRGAGRPRRLVCIEMVHGAAGSSELGARKSLWAPAETGTAFDLSPTSLRGLEPFRDHLTVVSNTNVRPADPSTAREIGGDHFRSSAVFLTHKRPRRTEGPDVEVGISVDQVFAQRFGQGTPIPSLQLCIEPVDQSGGCGYGYSCVYTDTISWASPTRPLPMIRDPRVAFDALFGMFQGAGSADDRQARRAEDRSLLDGVMRSVDRLRAELGASDIRRLSDYLETVREVERRIANVEARNASGEPRDLPSAPPGVPDSFSEHVRIMFDLQALAFASDVTRVFAFKMGRDVSQRTFPESGFNGPFHSSSHHGGQESRILDFAAINTYHVGLVSKFVETLEQTPDGDGTLLDHTLVLYGSPMGDSNLHNHRNVPVLLAGRVGQAIPGGRHLRAPDRTPLASVMLAVLHALGLDDLQTFGDSSTPFDLRGA